MARRSLRDIFARKSVEQMHAEHEHGELKKSLGATNLVLLGIGCIIGTGIFVLTGRAAAQFAGPAHHDLVRHHRHAVRARRALLRRARLGDSGVRARRTPTPMRRSASSPRGSWACCWCSSTGSRRRRSRSAGRATSRASCTTSGSTFRLRLRGAPGHADHRLRDRRRGRHRRRQPAGGHRASPPSPACSCSASRNRRSSTTSSSRSRSTVVVAFIVIGAFYVNPDLWSPLVPAARAAARGASTSLWAQIGTALWAVVTAQNTGQYGIPGIITAAATIFFAYIGFEAVSTAGAESKNPSRDMPIGILGSLIICTILYILTWAVLVGIVPYTDLNDPAPIAKAVNQIGLPWFALLVKIGAIAGLSSVMLVLLYGQTRIFYTMARDGLIPPVFAQVHPKFKTPWINTLIVGVLACGFAGFMGLDQLANLTNVGTLLAFAIVCITVIYLRFARPNMNAAVQDAAVSRHAAARAR